MGGDYSRFTFDAHDDFAGVLMQQGRVQLDADWNEQAAMLDRRWRAETIDIMGRVMAIQDGFQIDVTAGDIEIHAGRMYVDGMQAQNHGLPPAAFDPVLAESGGTLPTPYAEQPYLPNPPALPDIGSHLVYLDVWHRECGHLQHELVEKAVGVDTTTRVQTAWQVKVLELGGDGPVACTDSLPEWDNLAAPSAGRLSTGPATTPSQPDPCLIPPNAGYRGLENRLYRVEIHEGGPLGTARFKWSRTNATVASEVEEILSASQLRVASLGRDAEMRIHIGDWIEIADDHLEFGSTPGLGGSPGHLAKVTGIDEQNRELTIDPQIPGTVNLDATDASRHTRVVRWDQKQDAGADGLVEVPPAGPIVIEDNIQLEFSLDSLQPNGEFKVGDYWVFSVRTIDASVEALSEAPPFGTCHHFAKLAIATFPDGVEDCRPTWPTWKSDQGCCTFSVGDGTHSQGDYNSIQEAIDNLPAAGGQLCVLPGRHENLVVIKGRQNIVISGCGNRTVLAGTSSDPATDNANATDPVISITDSQHVRISALAVEAMENGPGIFVTQTAEPERPTEFVELSGLRIDSALRSAVEVESGREIRIVNCEITAAPVYTLWPAVFMIATDSEVLDNRIVATEPPPATDDGEPSSAGRGGVQLGGACRRIRVSNNLIRGGTGNGITLGSLELLDEDGGGSRGNVPAPRQPDDPCDPCAPGSTRIPSRVVDTPDGPARYRSAGVLHDIELDHNRISQMGLNGIGVAGFFALEESPGLVLIEGIEIVENEIHDCHARELELIPTAMKDQMGYGGISLAQIVRLAVIGNRIYANGTGFGDPVCGIFVLDAESTTIRDNRIVDNGPQDDGDGSDMKRGRRAGIEIVAATGPMMQSDTGATALSLQTGQAAVVVHANEVVQPVGRALSIAATGSVLVSDNVFVSRGAVLGEVTRTDDAAAVRIINVAFARDLVKSTNSFRAMSRSGGSSRRLSRIEGDNLVSEPVGVSVADGIVTNGFVQFNDNRCVLQTLRTRESSLVSSIAIFTLDDLSFADNQCQCDLASGHVVAHAILSAVTLRVGGSRFQEGLSEAVVSGITDGRFNSTTNNQSTHCLLVHAWPNGVKNDSGNQSYVASDQCRRIEGLVGALGG